MALEKIVLNALGLDLSKRVVQTTTVSASPALAAETVVATTPAFDASVPFVTGVIIMVDLAYTIGTSGTACTVKIRQTNVSGTVLFNSGAQTGGHNTAGQLVADSATGFDTAPVAGQTYCVTLQVTAGAAASTVSAVTLVAIAI